MGARAGAALCESDTQAIGFLSWLASVVEARITTRHVLIDGDQIAMEADMHVIALADLPDLPIGALCKRDHKVSRPLACYTTDGPIITHVRLADWPPRDPA